MFDLNRDEVKALIEEAGFDVVLMDAPIATIKGQEMRAFPRRVFEAERLTAELRMLRNLGVLTIGLYTVLPTGTYMDVDTGEPKESGGRALRWAYHKGI